MKGISQAHGTLEIHRGGYNKVLGIMNEAAMSLSLKALIGSRLLQNESQDTPVRSATPDMGC